MYDRVGDLRENGGVTEKSCVRWDSRKTLNTLVV